MIDFIVNAMFAGTPLLYGTLGEITNERVGHLNLGVEGMMALGACSGFMIGFFTNSFLLALIAAFVAGVLGALIYAIITITFMADQTVTGLTLTIFGVGLSNFIGEFMLNHSADKTLKLGDQISAQIANVHMTGLSDIPGVGPLLFSFNPFVYIGIAIAIILAIYFSRTSLGLKVRAIGENPAAADAAGINVKKLKYIHVLLGGGICGIGGAYASMITNGGVWLSNSVNGQGWIAVALVIFASWKPARAILGAFVFGAFSVLKFYIPKSLFPMPNAIYDMLPFLVTAIVLVISSVRKYKENQQPAGCGINYFREER
jgi:simple sugar transport system permease protein